MPTCYMPGKVNTKWKTHAKAEHWKRTCLNSMGASRCQPWSTGSWGSWPYIWAQKGLTAYFKTAVEKMHLQPRKKEGNFLTHCTWLVWHKDSTVILWVTAVSPGGPPSWEKTVWLENDTLSIHGNCWILATQHTWHKILLWGGAWHLVELCSSAT